MGQMPAVLIPPASNPKRSPVEFGQSFSVEQHDVPLSRPINIEQLRVPEN